jgi:large subunit ribosomal protein L21
MFAIVQSGGKQYRVSEGDVLRLEMLQAQPGDTVELPVMMLGGAAVQVGTPLVDGASVRAEVLSHGRGAKIAIYKFKAKSNYRRKTGHRQSFTEVRVTEILGAGGGAATAAAEPEPVAETADVEA